MNMKELKKIVKDIEKHKKAIAEHRDALRDIFGIMEDLDDSFSMGIESLEEAIECLSRNV